MKRLLILFLALMTFENLELMPEPAIPDLVLVDVFPLRKYQSIPHRVKMKNAWIFYHGKEARKAWSTWDALRFIPSGIAAEPVLRCVNVKETNKMNAMLMLLI